MGGALPDMKTCQIGPVPIRQGGGRVARLSERQKAPPQAVVSMLSEDAIRPACVYLLGTQQSWWVHSLFQKAFSLSTWLVLSCVLVAITTCIALTLCIESRWLGAHTFSSERVGSEQLGAEAEENWELSEFLLITVGACCQQGTSRVPNTVAARLLFITLFVLAVLVNTAFSAAVTSLVSSDRAPPPVPLGQLLRRPGVSLALQDSPYFRRAEVEAARFLTLPRGLASLASRRVSVLCGDLAELQELLEAQPALCRRVQTVPFTLALAPEPLAKNGSSWQAGLRRLEAGLWTRGRGLWNLRPTGLRALCGDGSGGGQVIAVSLQDVWAAPALLGFGLATGCVLLAVEVASSWVSRQGGSKAADQKNAY